MMSTSTWPVTLVPVAATATRPYHHGNLRAALLERAERTLAERGVGELSLRELARQVGVSHAAPRRHFADKQALLDALAEDGFERLAHELRAATGEAGPHFEAQLEGQARAYLRFATEHAALLSMMFAVKHRPDATEALRVAAERAFAVPLELFAAGQASGAVVAGDTERVAMVAWATFQGLATMANAGWLEPGELDEVVAVTIGQLAVGLRPR